VERVHQPRPASAKRKGDERALKSVRPAGQGVGCDRYFGAVWSEEVLSSQWSLPQQPTLSGRLSLALPAPEKGFKPSASAASPEGSGSQQDDLSSPSAQTGQDGFWRRSPPAPAILLHFLHFPRDIADVLPRSQPHVSCRRPETSRGATSFFFVVCRKTGFCVRPILSGGRFPGARKRSAHSRQRHRRRGELYGQTRTPRQRDLRLTINLSLSHARSPSSCSTILVCSRKIALSSLLSSLDDAGKQRVGGSEEEPVDFKWPLLFIPPTELPSDKITLPVLAFQSPMAFFDGKRKGEKEREFCIC